MKKVKKWIKFEDLYLLRPPLDFNFIFWDGFQLESSFSGRNLKKIEDVSKIRHRFECKGLSFGQFFLCKILAVFTIARSLFAQRKFSHGFFFFCSKVLLR